MSAPLVDLEHPWPLGDPHPTTGWRPPLSCIRLPGGEELRAFTFGDAVPGGYNGGFILRATDGALAGELAYNSGGGVVMIAMIEVPSAWRRRGVANALFMRLLAEFPDEPISPGLTTSDGTRWWQRVQHLADNNGVAP